MTGLMFNKNNDEFVPTGIHIMNKKTDLNILDAKLNSFMTLARKDEISAAERIFNEITAIINAPKKTDLSWSEKLKSIVDITAQSNEWEYSYHKFNKRYFAQNIYAPGRSFKDKEAITVIVDVSGSMVMKPGDIESAFGIIEGLLHKFKVYLLCIDETLFIPEKKDNLFLKSAGTEKPYEYKKGDWKYLKTGSNATTYFAPLFNRYMDKHSELLIVITDGYIYDLDSLKKYNNTLWLISEHRHETFNPPFGKSIKISSTPFERRLKITGRNSW
jgi:predicted metal-dependent peptidase